MDRPDLTNARSFVEAARPDSGDRWYVLQDQTVLCERRPGEYEPSIIAASTITNWATWREILTDT